VSGDGLVGGELGRDLLDQRDGFLPGTLRVGRKYLCNTGHGQPNGSATPMPIQIRQKWRETALSGLHLR
jgi:hypothetical protein